MNTADFSTIQIALSSRTQTETFVIGYRVITVLVLVPIAVFMSVLFSVIVSSRVNDVRSDSSFGILMLFPLLGIYLASETGIITLDINSLLIISGVLLAVDAALFFVSTATFRREEILTKWK